MKTILKLLLGCVYIHMKLNLLLVYYVFENRMKKCAFGKLLYTSDRLNQEHNQR